MTSRGIATALLIVQLFAACPVRAEEERLGPVTLKMRGLPPAGLREVPLREERPAEAQISGSVYLGTAAKGYSANFRIERPMLYTGTTKRSQESYYEHPSATTYGLLVPVVSGTNVQLETGRTKVAVAGTGYVYGAAFFDGDNSPGADLSKRKVRRDLVFRFPGVDYVYDRNARVGARVNGVKTPLLILAPIPDVDLAVRAGEDIDLCFHLEVLKSIWGSHDIRGTRSSEAVELIGGRACVGRRLGEKVGYLRNTVEGSYYKIKLNDWKEPEGKYGVVTNTLALENIYGTPLGVGVEYQYERASGEDGSRSGHRVMATGAVAVW